MKAHALAQARDMNGYISMLKEAHERLRKIEEHLAEQVLTERQKQARVTEDTTAYIRASGPDSGFFIPPELIGQFAKGKRISLAPNGNTYVVGSSQIYYLYTGNSANRFPDARTFVESIISDSYGFYSDGFANDLYIPEGQGLWIVNPAPQGITVNVALQIERYRPVIHQLSSEESYALAEGFGTYVDEGSEPVDLDNAPEEEQPEAEQAIDYQRTEPELEERPQPHFPNRETNIDTLPMHGEEDLL